MVHARFCSFLALRLLFARHTAHSALASPYTSFGLTVPGLPYSIANLTSALQALGLKQPQRVMWYAAWADVADFPAEQARTIAAAVPGATLQVTWEPWNPAAGVLQSNYTLDSITAGAHDEYISRWAAQISAYGAPLELRFAHEMNGDWYPWCEGVNGNAPGSYVRAWTHVRSLFDRVGVSNVAWIWCANVPFGGSTPLASSDIFSAGSQQVRALTTTRPLLVGEVGCPESPSGGGDKAAWVSDMFAVLQSGALNISAVCWFDFDKEADWRVDSSTQTLQAFRQALD